MSRYPVNGTKVGLAAAGLLLFVANSAAADPIYRSNDILNHFVPQIEADLGPTRRVCIDECAQPARAPAASVKPFDLVVQFEFNSDVLTSLAKQNLDEFAKALKDSRLAAASFHVDGHTDATGSEAYNAGLSERRAISVVRYLAAQGVDTSKLEPKGYGKLKPRVPNPFDPLNRRVEARLRRD